MSSRQPVKRPLPPGLERKMPNEDDFDKEIEAILGKMSALPSESYDNFRSQLPTLEKREDVTEVPVAVELDLPKVGVEDLSKECGVSGEGVQPGFNFCKAPSGVPEGLLDHGGYYFDESLVDSEAMQREWEMAGEDEAKLRSVLQDLEPESKPEDQFDSNGVLVQPLPPASSSGFFLDGPSAVQVDNWQVPASGYDDDDLEVEEGEWIEVVGSNSTPANVPQALSSPSTSASSGHTPPIRTAAARGPVSSVKTPEKPKDELQIEEMIIPPPRGRNIPVVLRGEEAEGDENDPKIEVIDSTSDQPKEGSKTVDEIPGQLREEWEQAELRWDLNALLEPGQEEAESGCCHCTPAPAPCEEADEADEISLTPLHSADAGEDEDAVSPFSLDPDFDYDNIKCTDNPIGKMREDWVASQGSGK